MKLIRLSLLKLGADPGELLNMCLKTAELQAGPLRKTTTDMTYLLTCVVTLKYRPKRSAQGYVRVPDKERIKAEESIEHYGNLISISLHTTRQLSSPFTCVGLVPETDDEKLFLQESHGFLKPEGNMAVPIGVYKIELSKHLKDLTERLDGVAILAEALGNTHPAGRFRECIRLFERAFNLSIGKLAQPLNGFLAGANLGYSLVEVREWIKARHGVSHAHQGNKILFEADVSRMVGRVMQAAYDVLLNKAFWRSHDISRRSAWVPVSGTSSTGCDLFLTQGHDWNVNFQVFDQFGRFPMNLVGAISGLEKHMWVGETKSER